MAKREISMHPVRDEASAKADGPQPAELPWVDGALTRCHHCQTVFRVPQAVLAAHDARVRCGECLGVFDAREERVAELSDQETTANAPAEAASDAAGEPEPGPESETGPEPEPEPEPGPGPSELLDQTFADFDLFSEEADLPTVSYADLTLDASTLSFETVDAPYDQTIEGDLFDHDLTQEPLDEAPDPRSATDEAAPAEAPVAATSMETGSVAEAPVEFLTGPPPRSPLNLRYLDPDAPSYSADSSADGLPEPAAWRRPIPVALGTQVAAPRRLPRWLVVSLILVSVLSIIALWAWRERTSLLENEQLRPWLGQACSVLGCELPARVSIRDFRALSRKITSHPEVPDALVIKVTFLNGAAFEQPWPVLRVSLSDLTGQVVAERDFLPQDYMDDWDAVDRIGAGQSLSISLEVNDPGAEASALNLQFASLKDARLGSD